MVDIAACRAYLQSRKRQRDQEREALRQQIVQVVRIAVPSVLAAFPQVRRAYVFGSMVRPGATLRSDSDIDVAIEGTLSAETYFALWREIERAIPEWVVEVVELGRDLHFAERVHQTGEMIYERSDSGSES
jgi:predicted nucleotidyltransferase